MAWRIFARWQCHCPQHMGALLYESRVVKCSHQPEAPGTAASSLGTLREAFTACAEHQIKPPKPENHTWMLPGKPWSRVHVDYAINFMGSNWLVIIDAYSEYPCIHPTTSTSAAGTRFCSLWHSHTIVSDNATSLSFEKFQEL